MWSRIVVKDKTALRLWLALLQDEIIDGLGQVTYTSNRLDVILDSITAKMPVSSITTEVSWPNQATFLRDVCWQHRVIPIINVIQQTVAFRDTSLFNRFNTGIWFRVQKPFDARRLDYLRAGSITCTKTIFHLQPRTKKMKCDSCGFEVDARAMARDTRAGNHTCKEGEASC